MNGVGRARGEVARAAGERAGGARAGREPWLGPCFDRPGGARVCGQRVFFVLVAGRPAPAILFPYTTLFRSPGRDAGVVGDLGDVDRGPADLDRGRGRVRAVVG